MPKPDLDTQRQAQGLNPLAQPIKTEPEAQEIEIDRTGFMDPEVMRGFPMMDGKHGLPGGGAISDTRPGGEIGAAKRLEKQRLDEARDLNGKARDIVNRNMRRTRRRNYDEHPSDG